MPMTTPKAGLIYRGRTWLQRRRRSRELESVRTRLSQRGIHAEHLSDSDLDELISDGRQALQHAEIDAGETTGAFVALVRKWEKF